MFTSKTVSSAFYSGTILPLLSLGFLLFLINVSPSPTYGEWLIMGETGVFYTDDAALFSGTRRLTRNQDPTQPVIDGFLAEQGEDIVLEGMAQIGRRFSLGGRTTQVGIRAQGFFFTDHTEFNHGSLGLQATHDLTPQTQVFVRYFWGPNLFLGENEERPLEESGTGPPSLADEELTTHYWAGGIGQDIPGIEDLKLILFGRYGMREYDKPFTHRDTNFWTIGTHVEFAATPMVDLALGYHYERGLADGRNEPDLRDDLSYYNHFVTGELELEVTEYLNLQMAIHYEFNGWTTGFNEDERHGEHENIVQGDLVVQYRHTETLTLTAGFQGAYRKESFEEGLRNLNAWVGARMAL